MGFLLVNWVSLITRGCATSLCVLVIYPLWFPLSLSFLAIVSSLALGNETSDKKDSPLRGVIDVFERFGSLVGVPYFLWKRRIAR